MPSVPPENTAPQTGNANAGELDLLEFFLLLHAHRLRILAFALASALLMVAYVLAVKPLFTSQASMLVPQQTASAASLALQAAAGVDLMGGGNEVYLDILKSRTVQDRLIAGFDLKAHYKVKEIAQAEQHLASRTLLSSTKEGLLQVTVQDEDPHMAAKLANGFLAELDHENQQLAIGSAAQQRLFFEKEMIKEKNSLADAEVALKLAEEKTGVVEPNVQMQASVTATETTRAQLRARQVQLGALLQSETPENPDVVRVRSEIAAIQGQLQAIQSQGGLAAGAPTREAPERMLTYVRNLREVKFHEALFELLSRQYANAKEQEAKNVSMIEILDQATPAQHKTWPPRSLYCLLGFIGGALLGVIYTILEKLIVGIVRDPQNRQRIHSLQRAANTSDASR